MSVVNDVLKNLDQRKSLHQVAGSSPFFYEEDKSNNKWLWFGLLLTMICCCVMASIMYLQSLEANKKIQQQASTLDFKRVVVRLPEDLFIADNKIAVPASVGQQNINDTSLPSNTISMQPKAELIESIPVKSDSVVKIEVKKNSDKIIAKKTDTSKASESAVAAINNGDMNAARFNLEQASRKVQEEVQLRLLLKDNPAEVLLRIKSKHRDYEKNTTLLALAAQGQQRAGLHSSAIELYKLLIPLEPDQSKWRAGLAISLESLGDKISAKRLYELALSMNNLPMSLRRFSESRLKRLSL
ncbi:MAG: tetratricopeptide (TPR) repeat protein [Bermanella sp.]|jgi:tetratricopeptide (TPR) repeat protein